MKVIHDTHNTSSDNNNPHSLKDKNVQAQGSLNKRLLNPLDRIMEILYGLIVALTITCTISVTQTKRAEVNDLFFETLGCNISWGLIDAVMYIIILLAEKGHHKVTLNRIRKSKNAQEVKALIREILPVTGDSLKEQDIEDIRDVLLQVPDTALQSGLTIKEVKIACGIFILVTLSTFPVALPFILIPNLRLAMRISNLLAIIMMFICGWLLAKYGGYNKLFMSVAMAVLGFGLVAITIILGG